MQWNIKNIIMIARNEAGGVMVIVTENRIGNLSSNPGQGSWHFT